MEWEILFSHYSFGVCLSMPSLYTRGGKKGDLVEKGLLLTYSFFSFWPSQATCHCAFWSKALFFACACCASLFPFLLSVPLCLSLEGEGDRK